MSRCSELLCKLNSIDELDLRAGVPIRKSVGLVGIQESTNWDRNKGIGKIPRQTDDDMYYFGFEYPMLPTEFLSLVPPRPDSHDDLVEISKNGLARSGDRWSSGLDEIDQKKLMDLLKS